MSGLAALFHRDGRPVDRRLLQDMLAAVPYRGLDGRATHVDGSLGLGHARMAVTPEDENEVQPLISPRTGCVVIADVRLDNRSDLLARLPDRPAPSIGDAEVILRSYEAWGVDGVAHLLGDFAFVLWDPRRRRMVCARDTSGQRCLFYRTDATTFAAASEIHQLLQDPAIPVRPNDVYIRERLVPLNMARNEKDAARTYYEGIYAVPAGHVLVVDDVRLDVRRYWELQPRAELRYRNDDDYAEHFLTLFSDVVAARLRTGGPIGALLSGGLDSSSIVCTAQRLYRLGRAEHRGFTTFSAVYGDLACDEEAYVREMQELYGFEARYIPLRDAAGRLQLANAGFVESPNMASRDIRDAVCAAAAESGVRVLLSGEMADACLGGGWSTFDSLLRQGQLGAFWRHLHRFRRLSDEGLPRTLLFGCVAPLLPLPIQRALNLAAIGRDYRRYADRWLPEWMPEPLRIELSRRHVQLASETERGRRFSSPVRHDEYNQLYPPEITRHPAPWPVEVWRPFADRRLHEFLLAIPPEQKFQPHPDSDHFYAGSKRIVRRAMRGIVPDSIRTRTVKTVFDSQFQHQVDLTWPAYQAAFGPGSSPDIAARGYVDRDQFWSRLVRLRNGAYERDLPYVLHAIGLETWLQSLKQPRTALVPISSTDKTQPQYTRTERRPALVAAC